VFDARAKAAAAAARRKANPGDIVLIPYYPPEYIVRGWKPEKISLRELRSLVRASRLVHMNPIPEKYFLANALVERRS
jgi:hypothetical protein